MPLYTQTGSLNVVVNDTSVSRGVYTSSGALRVTIVPGTSYVGRYASDGSLNVCIDSTGFGLYHPSGAIRGVPVSSLQIYTGLYSSLGSLNMYGLSTNSELLLFSDWTGFSLDFVDNSYTVKISSDAESLTGLTPSSVEPQVLALSFLDNTFVDRI